MMMPMRPVTTREERGVLILTLEESAGVNDGQSDIYRQTIYETIHDLPQPRVAVDLRPIDFLSSSGVALLIGLRRRIGNSGGSLVLFGLHPYVRDLLRVMKIAPLFRIADDEAGALAMLSPSPAV
jgi:anti-sigma B factor antagonist